MNVKHLLKARPNGSVNWAVVGLLATWVVFAFTTVWAVASDWSSQADQVTALKEQVDDHERRIRVVEQRLTEIATDVKWIRNHLEDR